MTAEIATQDVVAADASPDRWLAVLHGIFGSGRNWASVARRVVRARPEWGAVLVDLREHGESVGFEPPHTLERTAADLEALASGRDMRAVLGHSFGGKVALLRGRDDPAIEQVWVIDSTPEARRRDEGPWSLLELLRQLPDRFADRDTAVTALTDRGIAQGVALWMATNLERRDDAYGWRLDLDAIKALLEDFFRTDLWAIIEEPRSGLTIHFVRATGSSVLSGEATARIREAGLRTGQVFLHEVHGGHWLNADNPDAVVALLARGL